MSIARIFKNYFKNNLQIILFVFFLCTGTSSAGDGIIAGIVRDTETYEPLVGVTVRIEGTALGGSTNRDGRFVLHSVPSGRYILLSSLVGYAITKTEFSLKDQDSNYLLIELTPSPLQTAEIIASASKRIQAVLDVPISVVVVDQRAVQQRNITTVDELLRYIPGVTVSRDQVSIRGTSGFALGLGSRTLPLLDGFPMLSGDAGDIKFDAFPLFDVERIEVVKGATSALYGTGALGGVISFITREPKDYPEFRFRGYEGLYTVPRYEEWRYTQQLLRIDGFDASYSQKMGPVGWIFSGGIKGDDSYRAFDDSYRWNVFSKVSFAPTPASSMSVMGNHAYEDRSNWRYWRDLKNATRPPETTDITERIRSFKTTFVGEFKQIISDAHFVLLRGGSYLTKFENNISQESASYRKSTAISNNAEIQANSRLNEKIIFTYGGIFTRNDVNSNIYIIEGRTDDGEFITRGQLITAGYLQTEFTNLDGIIATVGSRLDIEKTFGEETNIEFSPKFGMSYASPLGVLLRMSLGRAFRAPSIGERNAALEFRGFTIIPNLKLVPEKTWSFELGANQDIEIFNTPLNYDFALFQNELYSLIEPKFTTSNGNPALQFDNITRARIQGVEFGVKGWLLKDMIGLESSVMGIIAKDLTTQQTLKYRSPLQWQSHILVPAGPVEFHADYRLQSRIESIDDRFVTLGIPRDADARVAIHVVDARLVLNFEKLNKIPMMLTLNAKNLFDYYYTEVMGNLAPTRSLSLQFDAKF